MLSVKIRAFLLPPSLFVCLKPSSNASNSFSDFASFFICVAISKKPFISSISLFNNPKSIVSKLSCSSSSSNISSSKLSDIKYFKSSSPSNINTLSLSLSTYTFPPACSLKISNLLSMV